MPIGEYYHGIALFKKERDAKRWEFDWADLAPWERHIWGIRQDYELAGEKWQGVVLMQNPAALDFPRQK